jgi:uncharacterized protein YndB with AHSA1/START domain
MTTDRIEKEIRLSAPVSRVWRAVSDAREFARWFGFELSGEFVEFVEGARVLARVTHPGYEHVKVELAIEKVVPERLIAWRWHPNAHEARDYSQEPTTLVTFELSAIDGGTLLRVVESGFDALPPERRESAFRSNEGGWTHQIQAISRHLATSGGTVDAARA